MHPSTRLCVAGNGHHLSDRAGAPRFPIRRYIHIQDSTPTTTQRVGQVALGFLHMGFNRGVRGTYAVFNVALFQAFGWSRGFTAIVLFVSVLVEGFAMPLAGSLVDRWCSRKTLLLGSLLLAAGLALSGTVWSPWQLYLWFGVVTALGLGLMGMVPHVAIIARQFTRRRGLAMGLAWSGGGLGLGVMPIVTQYLVDSGGWRHAFLGMGVLAFIFVVLPSGFLIPRDKPAPRNVPEQVTAGEWTVGEALLSTTFWLLFVSRVVASMGNQIITNHQVAHVVDIGYTAGFAASILGLMGVCSIVGRALFGFLTDVLSHHMVYLLVQVVSSVGILALVSADSSAYPMLLYIYAACYGLGQGSRALVLSAISADVFLGRDFGAIYGYFTLSIGIGGAVGALLGGVLYDVYGNYTVPFMIAFGNFMISIVMVWGIRYLRASRERAAK